MLSMTGFGRAESEAGRDFAISVEVSSINRKQLELRISLPSDFNRFELDVRSAASEYFSRGAVSIRIAVKTSAGRSNAVILPDEASFDELIKFVSGARKRNGISGEVNVESLLCIPGVMQSPALSAEDENVKEILIETVRAACVNCRNSRETEGAALKEEFSNRIAFLEEKLEEIVLLLPEIVAAGKTRLLEKIADLQLTVDANDPSFLREIVYLTDKSDVTEEITRLKSHFIQFRNYLAKDASCGRNLDFLAQEMFREINTLGNKSGNSSISPLVVIFKTELEKIREQIQNVE